MPVEDARAFMRRPRRPALRAGGGRGRRGRAPRCRGALPTGCTARHAGPHPVLAYFHGGGWVLGSLDSDDPLCRDLCVRSDAIIVSVDYRHAPESRFPAAADDAFAAVRWIATTRRDLGRHPRPARVAGWSAGANIAAVACQLARDAGGPPSSARCC